METTTIETPKIAHKRPISNNEFEKLKKDLIEAFDSDQIPIFNQQWERFSRSQANEIEAIIRYGEGVERWFEKIKSLYNMAKYYKG